MTQNSDEFLGERRRALEEEFFRKENEKLRQRLRAQMQSEEHRASLARAIGITALPKPRLRSRHSRATYPTVSVR